VVAVVGTERRMLAARCRCSAPQWLLFLPLDGGSLGRSASLIDQNALRKHAGKIAPAASELGVSRPTLYDLIEKLGIAKE
jgi:transcriptional regulator of acetoin/glycerol metabolism